MLVTRDIQGRKSRTDHPFKRARITRYTSYEVAFFHKQGIIESTWRKRLVMVWVIGVGLGLFLFFSFPEQMLALMLLIVIGVAIFFGFVYVADQRIAKERREKVKSISISASFDTARCSIETPILIQVQNGYTKTIQDLTFDLGGYREGHSSAVYFGSFLRSDRIILPGQSYESCWPVPALDHGARARPPHVLDWRASYSYATFED